MFILYFNKNIIFKKFLNFYSYKIILYISNKNIYCNLLSFFKFNIIFSISSLTIFLKNFIIINFGKHINNKIFQFISKCLSIYLLDLKIYNIRFKVMRNKCSKNLKTFFISFKNFTF
ncbi:50S ribosomal protein L18 [Candidatus Nasuia deltocephalinicola]|uniref:50S ribosomal protein L18 n=1 Tax=Candidatus Nasuia deltocephalincola TaxID=1160784 RepID=A0A7G6UHK7_9PROT|nr:50S ribosomal protein L18 [Candidatus Nasuia deltocephalinicola]